MPYQVGDINQYLDRVAKGETPPLLDDDGTAPNPLVLSPKSPMITARRMVRERYIRDGAQVLFSHGSVFYRWTGTHYEAVSEKQLSSDIYHFLENAKRPDKKSNLVPFDPNRSSVAEALAALAAVSHLSDSTIPPAWMMGAPDGIDALDLVSCHNGLLHLPTLEVLPHSPAFFTLNAIDYAYEPDAPEPAQWLQFLAQLWPDDSPSVETLQEMFGYCLTGDTSQQKALMLVGPKRSGKGTIARVLEAVIGSYNAISPTLAGLGTTFGLQPLIGKRVAVIADARLGGKTDTAIVIERILSITGEDAVTIDRKYLPAWYGRLLLKFFLISNELPRFSDASGALVSRFIVLVLVKSFLGHEDPGLTNRLLTELPSILNWAIAGHRRLNQRGHFLQPDSARDTIQDLEDLGSPIGAFIRDKCEIKQGGTVSATRLFDEWKSWCDAQGRGNIGTVQTFGRDLRAAVPGIKVVRPRDEDGLQIRSYEGVRLLY